jgi:hypothetical protein
LPKNNPLALRNTQALLIRFRAINVVVITEVNMIQNPEVVLLRTLGILNVTLNFLELLIKLMETNVYVRTGANMILKRSLV